MPTLLETLGAPPQLMVPTSVTAEPLPAPVPVPALPAIDEFAAFEDAAPADEFAAFEDAAPADEFSAFTDADDLDIKSVKELAADRDNFNPKEYYANHPELFSDPKKAAKFLDVVRIRDEEGLDAGQVAKAVVKETLPVVGKVAGGVRDVAEGALNVAFQPAANVFGGILTGDIFNKQRRNALLVETKKQQKRGVAQFGAGSEASATGIADLGRQGVRKLDALDASISAFAEGRAKRKKTDQELLQQIASDVEFETQLKEIVQGRGETAKAVGLDADTLAKEGITLDPEVIERLSLVDPLTIIAGGGIFKAVTAAGKTAFTATTRAAAEAALQRITQVGTRAATAPIRAVGKGMELAGTLSKKVAPIAPTAGLISGAVAGGATGILPAAGAGYLAGVGAARTLRIGGKLLESGGRGVAAAGEALGNSRILQQTLRGATEGVAVTAPLAAATDDDRAAGTLLGAGGLLGGGIRGAIATLEAPALAISRSRLTTKKIVYPETKSPGYGRDKALDAVHAEEIKTLSPAAQNEINSFRETARKLDSELYFLDDANFAIATQENAAKALGRELTGQEKVDLGRTASAEGFFDTTVPGPEGKPRRVLFLRKSADATTHEAGHLFFKTLTPERQADLVQSVRDSYTPEQIEQVRADQSQRLGEEKSTDYAINEIAADSFSQVFRNTSVSELTAPPGMLQKIRRNVTDFAEHLGLDLTAGERTASVGIASSLRFNDVVRDAARELLSKPRPPAVTPKPEPITLEQAARDLGPLVESRVAPTTETVVVDEARKIANEAPDTALPGAAMSQKEILGTVAEIIAGKEGARYNYRNAPDVPGAAEEASRAPRRAEIEAARNLPEDLRRMTETTGLPYRIVKSSGGVIQILDWAPDMLASNALRVAKALSDLAVKDPNNPVLKKVEYGLDVQKGEWTEQGWRDIFADAEVFSANQSKGYAGSGLSLEFPPEVIAAGRTAPAITGTPVALEQGIADFQNMLYNLRVPKSPRQGSKLPGNLVAQKISEATLPGRLRDPALVEPRKAGETGVRKRFKGGEEILDPNPLRAEFEKALQAQKIPLPDGIEVVRRLNLEHIADVVAEPNLPKTVGGVTPVLEAGFAAPKEPQFKVSGQLRGASREITVNAIDMAAARKLGEAQGMRVAKVTPTESLALQTAAFQAPEREWRVSGQLRGAKKEITVRALDQADARKQGEASGMRVAKIEAADKMTDAMFAAPRNKTIEGDGWIDPEGRFFHTTEHNDFAEGKLTTAEKAGAEGDFTGRLVARGWARIATGSAGKYVQAGELSKAQKITLETWASDNAGRVILSSKREDVLFDFSKTPEGQFAAPKELAARIENFTPDEFRAWVTDEAGGSLTAAAYNLGKSAPDRAFTDSLKVSYEKLSPKAMAAIRAQQFDDASAIASQAQFFREAYEAARGIGSAGPLLRKDPDYVPPYPETTFLTKEK